MSRPRVLVLQPLFTVGEKLDYRMLGFQFWLADMANGSLVAVIPMHTGLTTQQAAEFLNVSRPHVVRLLEEGRIPHRKVGTHRRIKMADVLEYKRREDAEAKAALEELAAEAQKHDLGY